MAEEQSEELFFLARKIKELREANGYTQEQLKELVAQIDGEGCSSLSSIENGHSRVTVQTLLTLSKIFKVPLDVFQKDKSHQNSESNFILEDLVLVDRIKILKNVLGEKGVRRLLRKICASIIEEHDELYNLKEEIDKKNPPHLKHDYGRHSPGDSRA